MAETAPQRNLGPGVADLTPILEFRSQRYSAYQAFSRQEKISQAMDLMFISMTVWSSEQREYWGMVCKYDPDIRDHVENQFPPDAEPFRGEDR